MNAPSVMLKFVVITHFILSVWGTMGSFMPGTYLYLHAAAFGCGLWAIGAGDSVDAIFVLMITYAFSILQDIILLALYEPRAHVIYEVPTASQSHRNEYRFALGMCILNLILKPFTTFLLFRIYQSRNNEAAFTIPGIDRLPGFGGMGGQSRGYEDIDRGSAPPYTEVETARPHDTVDKE